MSDKKINRDSIIPFGKYKGQPVETLLLDQSYLDWLMAQDWFRQRYQNIYTIVINYNNQPADTPEHNKMQVKFLNKLYQLKLAYLISGGTLFRYDQEQFNKHIMSFWEDLREKLELRSVSGRFYDGRVHLKEFLTSVNGADLLKIGKVEFEQRSIDVVYTVAYGYGEILSPFSGWDYQVYSDSSRILHHRTKINLAIELKPSIGDDFPSVLRQMKKSGSNTLVLQEYGGVGATWDEFVEYFSSQGFKVVLETAIDGVQIPSYDTILQVPVEKFVIPPDRIPLDNDHFF